MSITQGTSEWLEAKMSKIGASEIFTLVAHYCKDELKQANIDLDNEKAFKTPLELYLKLQFGVQDDSISEVNSQFGLGMEDYTIYRLRQEDDRIFFGSTKDFIVNEKISNLASCSPDGYLDLKKGLFGLKLDCYDGNKEITYDDNQGVLELKTTPYAFNFEAKKGLKWSYLFQLQYQMLVCSKKWGILAAIAPKEKSYDTDFFKGKVLGMLQAAEAHLTSADRLYATHLEYLNSYDYYNLYHYIYPENKTIHNLCILALKRFQKALDDNILPDISLDCLERLTRERKLLSKLSPERYGLLNARKDSYLDGLINDLKAASTEQLKIKTEMEAAKCDLIQKMDNHIGIEGLDWTYKFAKDGSLRFSKTKEGK